MRIRRIGRATKIRLTFVRDFACRVTVKLFKCCQLRRVSVN